jgi:DNA-binding GntR family transcriptional regulator
VLLFEIISIVGGLLRETRKMLVDFVPDKKADLEEHRDIYAGIAARNPESARNSMLRHLRGALNITKTDAFISRTNMNSRRD